MSAPAARTVCGEVSRPIVDPVARAVTHLVIEPKHRREPARLVPVGLIDSAGGDLRLRCTIAQFEVQGFLVDPDDHHVTHVLLREGHLWGARRSPSRSAP